MLLYRCDGCGDEIAPGQLRYTVKIDVHAAYEKMEVGLTELVRDHRHEILRLIERMGDRSAKELEESVYKRLELDLCPACQQAYIQNPLRFHPEQGQASAIDIDAFLRSLGYGVNDSTDE